VRVRIRLFAILRERAGRDTLEVDLPEGATVADALAALDDVAGGLPLVLAVNRAYAAPDRVLVAGDELALVPPVSGGAEPASVTLSAEPLDPAALRAAVRDPRAGAVVVFEGVTREVEALDYEAYEEMAGERIAEIARAARSRHGLCAVAVAHRTGRVPLSEPSVLVAVSAPHRGEAFAGAREVIDRVKAEAPIWKREPDGWVPGTPPPTS
jgi:molybdopterin synthase catalytic subunit/molybdopterin converting factor small subunit